jgi:uncharacterized protein YndB with AHSA1/START domain
LARNVAFPRHVLGLDADFASTCSTAVDITADHNGVVLRLACLNAFTVTLNAEATDALVRALHTGDVCAVLTRHDVRGKVLLGIRPHPLPGTPTAVGLAPMELELHLSPRHSVQLVFSSSRVPAGMSSHVHEFDAREGGSFRISLSYDAPDRTGKSAAHTDTYHGYFARLVPDEQVVEVIEFETDDPALRGTMTMTTTLTDTGGGTDVLVVHDGIPDGVPAADNETGTRMALANLARLVEAAT